MSGNFRKTAKRKLPIYLARNLQSAVDFLVSVIKDKRTLSFEGYILLLPVREIDEVLVVFAQSFDDLLVSLELS